ncbi:nucleotidyltransferase domain-containing protein [uncultured Roseibium sp.]|uniref:nucleotidyltransferase domain-containing protein n=1 Tax=uncultured Roseibium sp. TaxID=1936171 RepID=UPI0032178110
MDDTIVAEIRSRLKSLEAQERITIPLAIESGSRAWGFPSPDSDYDCRFVYVRPLAETFTLFPRRDVIEEPLTEIFDINGWELSKALRLMLAGNAVIVEWLRSTFAYQENGEFREAALQLAEKVCDRRLIGKHYYHLAQNQMKRFITPGEPVALKKVLYVLRPLMAILWLEANPDAAVAPMDFHELRASADVPEHVSEKMDELLRLKAQTGEIGTDLLDPSLADFLFSTFQRLEPWSSAAPSVSDREPIVDEFWRYWSRELAPAA